MKKAQTFFKMKGTVCAKEERWQQENSSGPMMLKMVEMGGEAIVQDVLRCLDFLQWEMGTSDVC